MFRVLGFSALQRAENSSIDIACAIITALPPVSVLFSEPKIPQLRSHPRFNQQLKTFQCSSASRKFLNQVRAGVQDDPVDVSVLFSEPKIPQSEWMDCFATSFVEFQCSSASRKFLNSL